MATQQHQNLNHAGEYSCRATIDIFIVAQEPAGGGGSPIQIKIQRDDATVQFNKILYQRKAKPSAALVGKGIVRVPKSLKHLIILLVRNANTRIRHPNDNIRSVAPRIAQKAC